LSATLKFVILSEAKDLLFARVTAADPGAVHRESTFPQPARKYCKFRIARRSFIRERFEGAVGGVGKGTTPAMHYRGSSEGRAFC
jgi:hypothetical protein